MYQDEEIAKRRYWENRKKYTNVDTGIYTGDEYVEFAETRIYGNIGVILPLSYQDMDLADAKKKYPSEQRPQIIKTNSEGTINFAFNLLPEQIEADQLKAAANDFVNVMKRLYPTNLCLDIKTGQGASLPYASIEFTSMAVNENLYNQIVLFAAEEGLLMMLFNCPFGSRTEWAGCLPQIIERLVQYQEEEQNEGN